MEWRAECWCDGEREEGVGVWRRRHDIHLAPRKLGNDRRSAWRMAHDNFEILEFYNSEFLTGSLRVLCSCEHQGGSRWKHKGCLSSNSTPTPHHSCPPGQINLLLQLLKLLQSPLHKQLSLPLVSQRIVTLHKKKDHGRMKRTRQPTLTTTPRRTLHHLKH